MSSPSQMNHQSMSSPTEVSATNYGVSSPTVRSTENSGVSSPTEVSAHNNGISSPAEMSAHNHGMSSQSEISEHNHDMSSSTEMDNKAGLDHLYNDVIYGHSSLKRHIAQYSTSDLPETRGLKNTILHIAAKSRKKETAEIILQVHPSLLHQQNAKGETPLHIAARVGDYEMAAFFIDLTLQVDVERNNPQYPLRIVNSKSDSILHEAVRNNQLKIVNLLIHRDQGLASMDNAVGESPLFLAVDREYKDIAECILTKAPDFSYRGSQGMDVAQAYLIRNFRRRFTLSLFRISLSFIWISLAVVCGIALAMPFALGSLFASVSAIARRRTLRRETREQAYLETLLLQSKHSMVGMDENGWTVLHYAARTGNARFIYSVVKMKRVTIYHKDKNGMSALHIAAKVGNINVIKSLVHIFPDISELVDERGRTSLHVEAENGRLRALKVLLGMPHFRDLINHQDNDGNSVFHLAAIEGNYGIIKFLSCNKLVDKAMINNEGMTAFDLFLSNMKIPKHEKLIMTEIMEAGNGALMSLKRTLLVRHGSSSTPPSGVIDPRWNDVSQNRSTNQSAVEHTTTSSTSQHVKPSTLEKNSGIDGNEFSTIVTSIIASITFAAAFQVPGGYDSSTGMAVLRERFGFQVFTVANYLAFSFAILSIMVRYGLQQRTFFAHFSYSKTSLIFMFVAFASGATLVISTISSYVIYSLSIIFGACFYCMRPW